jgi:hypothetical protein
LFAIAVLFVESPRRKLCKYAALPDAVPPGHYTAIVRGKNGASGVALVEFTTTTASLVRPLPFRQVSRRVHERNVGKGLREISKLAFCSRIVLFREKA